MKDDEYDICSGDIWQWMDQHPYDYGPDLTDLIESLRYNINIDDAIAEFRQSIERAITQMGSNDDSHDT